MPEVQQLEEQLETLEQRQEFVNIGEPPITGLKKKGSPERKNKCEDVKINDPETGLFMVADGVSTANGWFASREAGLVIQDILGKTLDEELENIARSTQVPENKKQELMSGLIEAELKRAVLETDRRIKSKTELDPRFSGDVATTISLARLVEMPDRSQHLFMTNVGDSRMFILRKGRLVRLTKDDSMLTYALNAGYVSEEDAKRVDQANGIDELPDHLRMYFVRRNFITRAVGGFKKGQDNIDVADFRLFPGDRVILASDGLTDQMKESQIEFFLKGQSSDRAAERMLQGAAGEIARIGTNPRAKADDISVIVRTIGERGTDRSYVRTKETAPAEPKITKEQVEVWRGQISRVERRIYDAKKQGVRNEDLKPLETELARLQYWVANMDLRELCSFTEPRFEKGDRVRIRRPDIESGFDPNLWTVGGYNKAQDQYIVSHPSGMKHQPVERFTLELWQSGDLVQPGDQIEMTTTDGKERAVYSVIGENEGHVVMIRQLPQGLERRIEKPAVVEQAIRAQLLRAHMAKKQMHDAKKRLLDTKD